MQPQSPEKMLAALRHSIALLQSDAGKNVDWYKAAKSRDSPKSVAIAEETFHVCTAMPPSVGSPPPVKTTIVQSQSTLAQQICELRSFQQPSLGQRAR
eukprot:1351246-Rhodomonas_salina.1